MKIPWPPTSAGIAVCDARYKTASGVLLQFVHGSKEFYIRASFPPEHLRQVKFAQIQRTHKTTTAEDLLGLIPEAHLVENVVIHPVPGKVGTYTYNEDALAMIPEFDWGSLLANDFLAPKAKKSKWT